MESLRVGNPTTDVDILGTEKTIRNYMNQMSQLDDLEKSISLAVEIMLKQNPLVEGYMRLMVSTKISFSYFKARECC